LPRREKWAIVGAILGELDAESERGANARLTNVAQRANVAYDRLQAYIVELEATGFVTAGRVPALTTKGRDFLRQFRAWMELVDRFGFGEGGTWPPPALRRAQAGAASAGGEP
jgi:predicted transcriptional regulator